MLRVSEVVKHLLIINVLMYFGTLLLLGDPNSSFSGLFNGGVTDLSAWGRYQLAMFYPTSEFFRPYQLVTHMFMHGDIMHLLFNMFALFMFGPPLEALWGPKRFLFFYLGTGLGAMLLYIFVKYLELQTGNVSPNIINIPMLGASGAVFGILAGYGLNFPNSVIQLLFPPIPLKAKYFVLIYAGIELFSGINGFARVSNGGVAHFAHVGGALFGLLLIMYWRRFGNRYR
ncbi:MAG: rhomboid family intramembrane serine protease [Saprospiraceae bacterium]|nr:rhomboid family intramembrane serine protease [Saprospiraceae bacterium]